VAHADEFSGQVVGISDGDTLTVLRGRTPVRVRLRGIDAPEAGQDFGSRAKQAASALAFGRVVTVEVRGTDRYGRTIGVVTLPDGRTLNHEMVRSGLAWWYWQYAPWDETLRRLEGEARAAQRGLWSHPDPVAPWDWRGHRNVPAALAGKAVGNRGSLVYHRPSCGSVARIAPRKRVDFGSEGEAAAAGYRPCKACHKERPGAGQGAK
jgi:endonuclease YncB( thermonuclease family)